MPQQYLGWVDACETSLSAVFSELDVMVQSRTEWHWRIYSTLTGADIDHETIDVNLPEPRSKPASSSPPNAPSGSTPSPTSKHGGH